MAARRFANAQKNEFVFGTPRANTLS